MFDHDDETPTGGYWPSVTDLFISLFIITIAILAAVFFISTNRGLGPLFGEIRKPTNQLREVVDLPRIRETQSPYQVVAAVRETCDVSIARIVQSKKEIARLEEEVARLKELVSDPDRIAKLLQEIANLKDEKAKLERRIKELEKPGDPGPEELARLRQENEELKRQLKENNVNVVVDEQRKEFRFDSGSPVIKPEFSKALRNWDPNDKNESNEPPFPRIAAEIIKRKDRVDTLEVIGHTDGVPLSTTGNLDQRLPELLAGGLGGNRNLMAGSNNDLGLLRALALKQEWLDYVESYQPVTERAVLKLINIRCYSAGQTILPFVVNNPKPDDFRQKSDRARRIEMRLTRLGKVADDD